MYLFLNMHNLCRYARFSQAQSHMMKDYHSGDNSWHYPHFDHSVDNANFSYYDSLHSMDNDNVFSYYNDLS